MVRYVLAGKSRKLPKAVKSEEFIKLIQATPKKDKVARVAFILAYGAGLRISEVIKLKKENISESHIEIWESKGKVDRTVPLPRGWKQWMLNEIPIKRGERTLQRKFKKYAKLANLQSFYVFHSLRHGFATRCVENGIPINHIQVLMGHSDISITGIYLMARPQDALKSYEDKF
tara:strand:- start:253 stop:774 length:522 start_codon:yes stop_codon:yes gene_type:complete